jgi:hypothetical protein
MLYCLQISQEQMHKILDLIESGKKSGAKLHVGGKREGDKGFFVQPTVFSDVNDDHQIAREEVMNKIRFFLSMIFFFCLKRFLDQSCKF